LTKQPRDDSSQQALSKLYGDFNEDFLSKRIKSPFPIRAKVHTFMHTSAAAACPSNFDSIVDLGCGDGSLTRIFIGKGFTKIHGADISAQNIQSAMQLTPKEIIPQGISIDFSVRDVTDSGFRDREFDICITSHVLEHLFSFEAGLTEQKRITKDLIVVALPTAWSPISWTLLGGGNYWSHGKTGSLRLIYGFLRTAIAFLKGSIGVDEKGYAGLENVPHIFFFPGRIIRMMQSDSWEFVRMQPQVQGFPWLKWTITSGAKSGRTGFGTIFILKRIN